jgi:competence protein ComEC
MKKKLFHRFDYENFYLWDALPLVKLLLGFILGIVIAPYFEINFVYPIVAISLLITFIFTQKYFFKRHLRLRTYFSNVFILLLIACTGILVYQLQISPAIKQKQHIQYHVKDYFLGIIKSEIAKTNSGIAFDVVVIKESKSQITDSYKIRAFVRNAVINQFAYGDLIRFEGKLNKTPQAMNPGAFDYGNYLSKDLVFAISYLDSSKIDLIEKSYVKDFRYYALNLRNYLEGVLIKGNLTEDELGIADALLLGKRSHISKEMMQAFSAAGTVHILAVSGLHVGMLYAVLMLLLKPLRNRKLFITFFVLSILWIYAFVTGLSPSVLRATVMFSFVAVGGLIARKAHILNILAASAFFLLLFDPNLIYKIGFQLSYLAVWGIVSFQPYLAALYEPKNKIIDYIWQLITVSIAAQLATAPIGLFYFHQFPNYFILANIVAIPLAFLIVMSGLMAFAFSFVDIISYWICQLIYYLIKALNWFIVWLSSLPGALTSEIFFDIKWSVFSYVILALILAYLMFRSKKYLVWPLLAFNLLLLVNWSELFLKHDEKLWIFYDKEDLVMGIKKGSVFYWQSISDDSETTRIPEQLSDLQAVGIRKVIPFDFNIKKDKNLNLLLFQNKTAVLIDKAIYNDCNEALQLDYCILSDDTEIDPNKFNTCIKCDQWILLANNSFYVQRNVSKNLLSIVDSTRIFSIKENGYFEFNFKHAGENQ